MKASGFKQLRRKEGYSFYLKGFYKHKSLWKKSEIKPIKKRHTCSNDSSKQNELDLNQNLNKNALNN